MTNHHAGLTALTALTAIAALAAAPAGAQELMKREFSVVGSWSTSSLYPDHEVPFWTETLPEASDGRITANLKAFDELGLAGNAVYELVQQGVYDVGATVMDYVAGVDPRLEGLDLPGVADPARAREIAQAYRPQLEAVFEETFDSQLLAVVPFTSQVVFCNAPIEGLEDFDGKRIRGSGRMTIDFIEALGGTGVDVSFNEVTIALERGVIDCGITGSLSGYLAGWPEAATHFYPLPAGGWDPVGIVMRGDVWEGLDEPTRTFLEDQFAKFEERVWSDAEKSTEVGVACNTDGDCPYGEAAGLTLVDIADADLKTALETMEEDVLPLWAERCGGSCIEKWNSTVGEVLDVSIDAK